MRNEDVRPRRGNSASPGITFEVTKVELPKNHLSEVDYHQAIRTIIAVADMRPAELESSSKLRSKLVRDVYSNPFIAAVRLAYADHRPLCLSPDMIWLLIEQGAALHINAKGDKLRRVLVMHEGKKAIEIATDKVRKGNPDNDWLPIIEVLASKVLDNMTVEARDLFLTNFTTTGPTEKTAFQIALLDAMRRFFEYTLQSLICGIPSITLEGTASDWQQIADRFEALRTILDLDWWIEPVRPILRQFVQASKGNVDIDFWRSIYREYQGIPCLIPNTSLGWIYAFFPYLNHGQSDFIRNPWLETQLDRLMSPPKPKPLRADAGLMELRDEAIDGISDSELPIGLSKAPFIWHERLASTGPPLATYNMEFLAGFVGVSQDMRTRTLRPEIGWAVRESPSVERSAVPKWSTRQ